MFVYFRAPVGWGELARRTVKDSIEDGVPGLAAQLAFYFFLALFPTLLFLVSLLAYLPFESAIGPALARSEALLPGGAIDLIRQQIDQVRAGDQGGLLTFAIAGAIWSSSAAMTAIISALNRAYDITEFRPWWKMRLLAVALTLALAVFSILALAFIVGGADLARWVTESVGGGALFESIWTIAQWVIAIVLVIIAIDLVYHFAPNADAQWVWVTPGSLLATALWLAASFGFRFYVQNFGNYTAVYGAIGSVIVLMLWFYLAGFALLVGAELNAEIDRALPTHDDGPQTPERRKKIGAAAAAGIHPSDDARASTSR